MLAALLGMRGWLDPIFGFLVEFGPLRLHRLAGAAAGQHDQAHAIGSVAAKVVQSARDALKLGLTEISLTRLFAVARDAFARVALDGVAPGQGFTSLRHQRERKHLRGDAQDAVSAYRSPALGDPPMHLGNVTTVDISN